MAKRKASTEVGDPPRRSLRRRSEAPIEAQPTKVSKTATTDRKPSETSKTTTEKAKITEYESPTPKATVAISQNKTTNDTTAQDDERQYWLLKAEPETRIERGVDVRFSIDDLRNKTEPEPWDGIRNYAARNNLRAMRKGDLAFFYHSNTKVPGIVGTMEIVQEHSPDWSAHDAKTAYYDPKSTPEDPKWSVVHVEFRSKFKETIGLPELRAMGAGPNAPLANMQLLKQSRLSVSKVSAAEWAHLMSVAKH